MSKELIFTSAPRGLIPGSNGYCTVAMSEGLPNSWRERLESLSVYTRHFPPDDPRNPVVFSHLRVNGRHVVSRISEAGKEHTDRTNHLAHHLILEDAELPAAGPAWLLRQPEFLEETWSGAPRWLDPTRPVPEGDCPPRACHFWEKLAGDAGWAGVLAEKFLEWPDRSAVVIYDGGQQVLPLLAEAIALLPAERRWDVTFSTYFTGLLPGLTCAWRGVLRDTDEAKSLRRRPDVLVIDLAKAGRAPDGPLVELARTGHRQSAAPRPRKATVPDDRPRPAPAAEYPMPRAERPEAPDPFESLPPMPPLPPRRRAAESAGWGSRVLVGFLVALVAAAATAGVWVWQSKKAEAAEGKAAAAAEAAAEDAKTKLISKDREIKRLNGELTNEIGNYNNAKDKLRNVEKDLEVATKERDSAKKEILDLRKKTAQQKQKADAFDLMTKSLDDKERTSLRESLQQIEKHKKVANSLAGFKMGTPARIAKASRAAYAKCLADLAGLLDKMSKDFAEKAGGK